MFCFSKVLKTSATKKSFQIEFNTFLVRHSNFTSITFDRTNIVGSKWSQSVLQDGIFQRSAIDVVIFRDLEVIDFYLIDSKITHNLDVPGTSTFDHTFIELGEASVIVPGNVESEYAVGAHLYFGKAEVKLGGEASGTAYSTGGWLPGSVTGNGFQQANLGNLSVDLNYEYIYSDPEDIQNNVLIRSKRLEHWKRDSINGQIENNNDPQLILIDAGPDILIDGESFETYFPRPKEEGGIPSGFYNTFHYKTFDNNGTEDTVFLPHDIVLIKFCQIDEPSLKFWRGVVRQFTTNGNPFSEPMNLVSNINNGLGCWTGYGAVYYKVSIIKDTTIFEEYDVEIIDIF